METLLHKCKNAHSKRTINLLDIDNRATLCNDDKHKPCDKNSKEPMCNIGIQCTPYLCNRDIVPTNMKMPNSCGF